MEQEIKKLENRSKQKPLKEVSPEERIKRIII